MIGANRRPGDKGTQLERPVELERLDVGGNASWTLARPGDSWRVEAGVIHFDGFDVNGGAMLRWTKDWPR